MVPAHLVQANLPSHVAPQHANLLMYGRAPLGPCLEAICRASPELLPDGARDFSVYVLDPLETHPHSNTSSVVTAQGHPGIRSGAPGTQPQGVAIGLGLMSWALQSPDSDITVTGTLIADGIREDALEVVFALRETAHAPNPALRRAWSATSTVETQRDVKPNRLRHGALFTNTPLPARTPSGSRAQPKSRQPSGDASSLQAASPSCVMLKEEPTNTTQSLSASVESVNPLPAPDAN
ncbi:hypothetical protein CERSUDRAFT_124622, partial [Gelatoporia subvermispora B]